MKSALEVSPGVVSDETTFSTPGVFSDANNVRFRYGKPEPVGGWVAYHATTLTGVCRSALAWTDALAQPTVAFGTHSALMAIQNGELADITPAGLTAGEIDSVFYDGGYGNGGYGMGGYGVGQTEDLARTWSLATRGEALIASPSGGSVYIWENDISQVATIIATAPDSCGRMLVATTQQIIVFGCANETTSVYDPMLIRGSDIDDYTDFTTGASDNAFSVKLEGGGVIIDAQLIGDNILVWTDTSLFLGQYVAQPEQPWRFDRIAENCGLAGAQSAVVVGQTAYWLTPDLRFFAYVLGTVPQEVVCPIRREFRSNIDVTQLAKVVCQSNSLFNEVWWFYPDERDGDENSRFVMLNIGDGSWSKGDIARTAAIDSGTLLYPLAVTYGGQTYLHENGTDADGAALSWSWRTSPQYVDEGNRRVMLRSIWPDFEAQEGDVTLKIYGREYPQGTDTLKTTQTLAVGRDKKDFRVTGKMFSVDISASAIGTFARMGKPIFDVELLGER